MTIQQKLIAYEETLKMLESTVRTMMRMDRDGTLTEHGKGSLERAIDTLYWLKSKYSESR